MNDMFVPASSAVVEESEYVWPEVGHIGKVPLDWLLPDPEQPRQNFDKDELHALAKTLKAGGQRDIATVTPLTDEEKASGLYHPIARGWIVGGERRWRALRLAGIPTIEIRPKLYASVGERALDAFMLNEQRVALSDIENAIALDRVIQKNGWQNETQSFIAEKTGKPVWWVSEHMRLLWLYPQARAKMDPTLPQEEQLKRQSALFLAGFEHHVQVGLLAGMSFGRTTAKQQIIWMKQQLEARGIAAPTRKQPPASLRRLVCYFGNQTSGRIKTLLGNEGFDRLFDNTTLQQRIDVIAGLRDAQNELHFFVERAIALSTSANKPGVTPRPATAIPPPKPVAPAPPTQPARPAPPAVVHRTPAPFVSRPPANPSVRLAPAARPDPPPPPPVVLPKPRPEVRYVRPVAPKKEPLPQTVNHTPPPLRKRGDEKALGVLGDTGRVEMRFLGFDEYLKLKARGRLGYQIRNAPQPPFLVEWEKSYENSSQPA